jgi:hypothetical protein
VTTRANPAPIQNGDPCPPVELRSRVAAGDRLVRFEYCFSVVVATVRRQSPVVVTSSRLDRYLRGLGYSVLALLLGPWGVPWGPVWTVRAVWVNLTGGTDVTEHVLADLDGSAPE